MITLLFIAVAYLIGSLSFAILVSRAMRLLQPRPGERIADLFCGLGNF